MPRIALQFGITPVEDTFTPALTAIEARAVDIAPMYDALYSAFRVIERKRFDSEGPGWEPLADSTVAGRERMGIGGEHPILNRTGVLRRSLTTKGAKYSVVEPLPDGLFMGTKDPLAKYHQEGTHGAGRDHSVDMPARPVVDLTEDDAEVFAGIIGEWIYGFEVSESSFEAVAGAI